MPLETIVLQGEFEAMIFCIYGSVCLFQLLFIVVVIYATYWVYGDANSKGENATLWALLTFLFFPWGLVIYMVQRDQDTGRSRTDSSGSYMGPGRRQVMHESGKIDYSGVTRTCRQCTREIPLEVNDCPYCGYRP